MNKTINSIISIKSNTFIKLLKLFPHVIDKQKDVAPIKSSVQVQITAAGLLTTLLSDLINLQPILDLLENRLFIESILLDCALTINIIINIIFFKFITKILLLDKLYFNKAALNLFLKRVTLQQIFIKNATNFRIQPIITIFIPQICTFLKNALIRLLQNLIALNTGLRSKSNIELATYAAQYKGKATKMLVKYIPKIGQIPIWLKFLRNSIIPSECSTIYRTKPNIKTANIVQLIQSNIVVQQMKRHCTSKLRLNSPIIISGLYIFKKNNVKKKLDSSAQTVIDLQQIAAINITQVVNTMTAIKLVINSHSVYIRTILGAIYVNMVYLTTQLQSIHQIWCRMLAGTTGFN
eukprot:TRINITY_DN556_c0_g1_i1.p5 TRINITY_DN556_c0_g1~~TRINITY_DN556_c0_g1_i1.p5  ORF type:complete len:351 (+),score=-36.02 TRINITY_DN556_c0_g1_i1:1658-2710(+)